METALKYLFASHDMIEWAFQTLVVDNFSFIDMAKTKYMFVLTFNFLLAFLWRLLPNNPKLKVRLSLSLATTLSSSVVTRLQHAANILVGVWVCALIDRSSLIYSFVSSLVVYVIMIVFPTNIGRFVGSGLAFALSTYGCVIEQLRNIAFHQPDPSGTFIGWSILG